jgi:YTH domain-containing family protein
MCIESHIYLQTDQIVTSQTHPENLYQASPPTATGAVRRHASMTDGPRARKEPDLRRHPTLSGKPPMRSSTMNATTEAADDEYPAAFEDAEEDPTSYPPESAYAGIQQASWDHPTPNDQTWRADQQQPNIEEVMNNLSNLDIQRQGPNYARGGPRFDPNAPGGYPDYAQQLQQRHVMNQAQRLPLNTEVQAPSGPVSASAYVPAPGHNAYHPNRESMSSGDDHHRSASGSEWDRKSPMLRARGSNPNIWQGYQTQYGGGGFGNMPPPPPIPAQYLNQVQAAGRLGGGNMPLGMGGYGPAGGTGQAFGPVGGGGLMGQSQGQPGLQQQPPTLDPAAILSSPIDVPSMIAQKGYNPANFDTRPPFVSFSLLHLRLLF